MKHMINVIGLMGDRGAGKDTVADMMMSEIYSWTECSCMKVAFADWLRETCSEVFSIEYRRFLDQDKKEKTFRNFFGFKKKIKPTERMSFSLVTEIARKLFLTNLKMKNIHDNFMAHPGFNTPREMLQFIGTDICRDIVAENFHLRLMEKNIESILERSSDAIIIVTDIRYENEAELIRKFEGPVIKVDRKGTTQGTHSSDDIGEIASDIVIKNDADLEELHTQVIDIINDMGF